MSYAALILAGLIAALWLPLLWTSGDLRDGNIDNTVAATIMSVLIGLCIGFGTGEWGAVLIGLLEPGIIFAFLRPLYKRLHPEEKPREPFRGH